MRHVALCGSSYTRHRFWRKGLNIWLLKLGFERTVVLVDVLCPLLFLFFSFLFFQPRIYVCVPFTAGLRSSNIAPGVPLESGGGG